MSITRYRGVWVARKDANNPHSPALFYADLRDLCDVLSRLGWTENAPRRLRGQGANH